MTNNIVYQFIRGTPPITRILISLIVLTTLLVYLNVLQPHQLTYSRYYLPKLQFHRIITTFLYFGKLNLEVALHIFFFYRYSLMLEESFQRTSDYFYMLLLIAVFLFVLSNIYYIPLLGSSLSCTITYIWTRRNPQTVVQIMGFISFYAFYLPFIVPMFTLIFDGKISMVEIVGIIVGHVIFYLRDVYPRFGRAYLRTPCWCHRLFNEQAECCTAPPPAPAKPRAMKLSDIKRIANETAESEHMAETYVNSDASGVDNAAGDSVVKSPVQDKPKLFEKLSKPFSEGNTVHDEEDAGGINERLGLMRDDIGLGDASNRESTEWEVSLENEEMNGKPFAKLELPEEQPAKPLETPLIDEEDAESDSEFEMLNISEEEEPRGENTNPSEAKTTVTEEWESEENI